MNARYCILGLLFVLSAVLSARVVPVHMVGPEYPAELLESGFEGRAVVAVYIGLDGSVESAEVASAAHPAFGEAALAAVRQWRFEPVVEEGRLVRKQVRIPFDFSIPMEERLNRLFQRPVFKALDPEIPVARTRDFEPRLRPLAPIVPRYPEAFKGTGRTGKVVLRFVLDTDGRPINPEVVESDDDLFSRAALLALLRASFPPPVKEGKPVYVNMRRDFEFADAAPAPAAPPRPRPSRVIGGSPLPDG